MKERREKKKAGSIVANMRWKQKLLTTYARQGGFLMRFHRLSVFIAFGLAAAFTVTVVPCLWLTHANTAISNGSFHRIRLGMTKREVQEIIGVAPGDYATNSRVPMRTDEIPTSKGWTNWIGNDAIICVHFDDHAIADQLVGRFSAEEEK